MENGIDLYERIQEVGRSNEKIKQDAYFSLKSEEEWLDKRFTELALKHIPSQMDENERKTSAKRSFDKMEAKLPSIDPKSMKVVELRAALRDRGLCTKGLKAQLIKRLTEALNDSTDTMMDTQDEEKEKETKLDPSSLRVVDLRRELSARGLNTKGLKAVLIKRLEEALENEETSMDVEKDKTMLDSIDEEAPERIDSPPVSQQVPERVSLSPVPHQEPESMDERITNSPEPEVVAERMSSSPQQESIDERRSSPLPVQEQVESVDERMSLPAEELEVSSMDAEPVSEAEELEREELNQTLCLEDEEADRLKEEAEQEAMAREEQIQRELAEKRRISEQLRRKRILEEAERLRQERQNQIERANERAELETMRMEEEQQRKFAASEKRRLEKEQQLRREKQQKMERQKQIEDEARKFRENVRNTIKQKTTTSTTESSSSKSSSTVRQASTVETKTAARSGKPSNLVSGLHSFTTLVDKPTTAKVKKDPPRPIAALRMAEKNRLAEEKKAQQKKIRMQQRREEIKRMEEKKKAALQLQRQQVSKQNKAPVVDKPRPKPMKDPSTQLQELRAADEKRRQEAAAAVAKKPIVAAVKPTPIAAPVQRPESNQVPEQPQPYSKGLSISDRSDSDSDRSEKNRSERDIPTWAQRENLKKALSIQFSRENAIDPVPSIFPEFPPTCDLEAYFQTNTRKSRFTRRSSSSAWQHDRATEKDRENYRRDMGFVE